MLHLNRSPQRDEPLALADELALGRDAARSAQQMLTACPRHAATRLRQLPHLARSLGIAGLVVKDESSRLGLGSFKALGGAYAVVRLAIDNAVAVLKRHVDVAELFNPEFRATTCGLTFACATDGNHGRSVAAGARLVGAKAVVFVHEGVSDRRIEAIARYGVEVERVAGSYDDSVAEALRRCESQGWTLVADTSREGYERIPRLVMQGYTIMVREILDQLEDPVSHVFLQAGVGGFAAAVAAHLGLELGRNSPRVIVVEPERAACLYRSAQNGRLTQVPREEPTIMAMLECYEPSSVAWQILARRADAFMTVTDAQAVDAMVRFALPLEGDPAILSGESGGVGLAGLLSVLSEPGAAAELGLGPSSRVLLFNTEGATDPDIYFDLTGLNSRLVANASEARVNALDSAWSL